MSTQGKGASIKYVRRFSGFFDPLPPLVRFSRNLSVLSSGLIRLLRKRQYFDEKRVGFGSNHPKSGLIIEQNWFNR